MTDQYKAVRRQVLQQVEQLSLCVDFDSEEKRKHLFGLVRTMDAVVNNSCDVNRFGHYDMAMALAARERCFAAAAHMLKRDMNTIWLRVEPLEPDAPDAPDAAAAFESDASVEAPPPPPKEATLLSKQRGLFGKFDLGSRHERSRGSVNDDSSGLKKLIIFNFNQTISVEHMFYMTKGENDVSKLTNDVMRRAFNVPNDDGEYLNRLRTFWSRLHRIPNVEIFIVSAWYRPMLEHVLKWLDLMPAPANVIADYNSLSGVLHDLFRSRDDVSPNKTLYVNHNVLSRGDVARVYDGVTTCCDAPESGLTQEMMQHILQWATNPNAVRAFAPLQRKEPTPFKPLLPVAQGLSDVLQFVWTSRDSGYNVLRYVFKMESIPETAVVSGCPPEIEQLAQSLQALNATSADGVTCDHFAKNAIIVAHRRQEFDLIRQWLKSQMENDWMKRSTVTLHVRLDVTPENKWKPQFAPSQQQSDMVDRPKKLIIFDTKFDRYADDDNLVQIWTQLYEIPDVEIIVTNVHYNAPAFARRVETQIAQVIPLKYNNAPLSGEWRDLYKNRLNLSPSRTLFVPFRNVNQTIQRMKSVLGSSITTIYPTVKPKSVWDKQTLDFVLEWAKNPQRARRMPLPLPQRSETDALFRVFHFDIAMASNANVFANDLRQLLTPDVLRNVENLQWCFRGSKVSLADVKSRPVQRVRFDVREHAEAERLRTQLSSLIDTTALADQVDQFEIMPSVGDLSLSNLPLLKDNERIALISGAFDFQTDSDQLKFEHNGFQVRHYFFKIWMNELAPEDAIQLAVKKLRQSFAQKHYGVVSELTPSSGRKYVQVLIDTKAALEALHKWYVDALREKVVGQLVVVMAELTECLATDDPRHGWLQHSFDQKHQNQQAACHDNRNMPYGVTVEVVRDEYVRYMIDKDDEQCLPKIDASALKRQVDAQVQQIPLPSGFMQWQRFDFEKQNRRKILSTFSFVPESGFRLPLVPADGTQIPTEVLLVLDPETPSVAHVQTSASADSRVASIALDAKKENFELQLDKRLVRSMQNGAEDTGDPNRPRLLASGQVTLENLIYLLRLAAKVARVERVVPKLHRMAQLDAYAPGPDAQSHMLYGDRLGSRYHFVRGRPCQVPAVQMHDRISFQQKQEINRLEALLRANRADVHDMRRLAQLKAEEVARADS